MSLSSLLVANRGEVAVRVVRAALDLGMRAVAVYSRDDAEALHVRLADEAIALDGEGAAPYLDAEQLVAAAQEAGVEAVHPGWGFLAENARFAAACREAGLTFAGPRTELLELFGDKLRARAAAAQHGIPTLAGNSGAATLDEARRFMAELGGDGAVMLKAVAGGGGRGVRLVSAPAELDSAFQRASSEAKAAFGSGDLYIERYMPAARHIEVQVAGDAPGNVTHIWERDCSIQRRFQKLLEIAPAPSLDPALRERILESAVTLARATRYDSLGTFEFLVDASAAAVEPGFAFIEANARLQVEHTVTEEVTGLDLVQVQLRLAAGESLADVGLGEGPPPVRGFAVQARVNMETVAADGSPRPSSGTLEVFEPPAGPGVRVDTFGYTGYRPGSRFDSLLAKVIAHSPQPDLASALARLRRALGEFRIEGLATNAAFLAELAAHPDVVSGASTTRFLDEHAAEIAARVAAQPAAVPGAKEQARRAGATIDASDPLAVLAYGQSSRPDAGEVAPLPHDAEPGAVLSPVQGTVIAIEAREGDEVPAGTLLLVMESMKMEHEVRATVGGTVRSVDVAAGDTVYAGHPLLVIDESDVAGSDAIAETNADLDEIRPDLREVLDRLATTLDENRPRAVERRRNTGQRTARQNVDDLLDDGTFVEYGPLVLAAQRRRRTIEDLIERSPADGMITGVGTINGHLFDDAAARCAVLAYDYTVFAGTQGGQNHRKTDRMIHVAHQEQIPLILFAEGGGGRPGDTDGLGGPGDTRTFAHFAQLSGLVPLIGITSGRCFAGNASLLGCCDVIIATENSNIGMGGPAMIEGGGLGVFAPEEIGPMSVQVPNGVVDIAVADEAEAVAVTKRYLSYFQGPLDDWEAPDQRLMRRIIPENRLRVYDVRKVVETLADLDSVLELRPSFGHGSVTSLIRVEGRPLGVVANNPAHLGGAIDSDGADKAARFIQLCDAHGLPVLYLCDTPGIMVGPEVEHTALVRHANRMFLIGANITVPYFTVILRKAYGLGAIAMAGGSYKQPHFTVSWPTGEYGGMGLEGSVKLGYRNELAAIEDPEERTREYEQMVARAYEHGRALNQASLFGVDDTIDPAETRRWVASGLRTAKPRPLDPRKRRPAIDGW